MYVPPPEAETRQNKDKTRQELTPAKHGPKGSASPSTDVGRIVKIAHAGQPLQNHGLRYLSALCHKEVVGPDPDLGKLFGNHVMVTLIPIASVATKNSHLPYVREFLGAMRGVAPCVHRLV